MTAAASPEPSRRKRYERSKAAHPLTTIKLEVLRAVALSHYLSTPQVAGIVGLSEKAVRDHLRDLYDMEFLDVLAVPKAVLRRGELGMAAKVHYPTRAGIKTLREREMLEDTHTAKKPGGYVTLPHQLAVRDTLVWLSRSARSLSAAGHCVERWECSGPTVIGKARPDALFVYRFEPGEEGRAIVGLVETDRGTERAMSGTASDQWAVKVAAYGAVFGERSRDTLYNATGFENARIVVTVETDARAVWIARKVAGSPMAAVVWIASRADFAEATVYDTCWWRPTGERQPFLSPELRKGSAK